MTIEAPVAATENTPPEARPITAYYLSGTHWDREWYRPLAEFRFLLVRLLDRLLDLMENNEAFRFFHLDGQTCVLDDYMALRPDQRPRLERLIHEGRVLIGPWYTMPDLFCVGDEALVRNLLLGRQVSREWGVEPMPIAFTCDMFGHPSQMPQIYRGFGMTNCVMGRGTNEHTTPPLFWWEAPDGSRVFSFKVQDKQGYGAFAVPRAALEGPNFLTEQVSEIGSALDASKDDPKALEAAREEMFKKKLRQYLEHEIARFDGPVVCLMDWMDHSTPAEEVERYLRLIQETDARVSPEHSTLPQFFEAARAAAAVDAPSRRGELYEPSRGLHPYLYLIPNCVSSRVRMKQANDRCQNLLEKWAEPWVFVANLEGADLHESFLRDAWQQLLLNHAHDSICGCSIDQVHRDMGTRFDHVRLSAEQLRHQALGALTAGCGELAENDDEFTVTIANATPHAQRQTVVFDIDLPLEYPTKFAEGFSHHPVKMFTLATADGKDVTYQRLHIQPSSNERSRFAQYCFMSDGAFERHTVAAELDMPGVGFTSLRVIPSPKPVRTVGTLRTGPTSAANEHLAIVCEANGTLTMTDLATGETYRDLLMLSDRSEIGDGWFHDHAPNDQEILSSAGLAQITVVEDGPLSVAFAICQEMTLPMAYDRTAAAPSPQKTTLRVSHKLRLRKGSRYVEVATTIDNTVKDHRLQLLLPSDVTADTWWAHHPFDFVERSVAIDPQTVDWQEMEQVEKPFLGIQAVGQGSRGLAFVAESGLHEGGVRDDQRRTMQVTLLRAYSQTISTGGEIDGQEAGEIVHRYALMPFADELPKSQLLQLLAGLQAGVLTRQSGRRPSGHPPLSGDMPTTQSFVRQLDGALALSAIKAADADARQLIVRLWNPDDDSRSATLKFWRPIAEATMVHLNEDDNDDVAAPAVNGDEITVTASARQIASVRLRLE